MTPVLPKGAVTTNLNQIASLLIDRLGSDPAVATPRKLASMLRYDQPIPIANDVTHGLV